MTHEDEETRLADEYTTAKHYLAEAVWREMFCNGVGEVDGAVVRYDVARAAVRKGLVLL